MEENNSSQAISLPDSTWHKIGEEARREGRSVKRQAAWIIEQHFNPTEEPQVDQFLLESIDDELSTITVAAMHQQGFDAIKVIAYDQRDQESTELMLDRKEFLTALNRLRSYDPGNRSAIEAAEMEIETIFLPKNGDHTEGADDEQPS